MITSTNIVSILQSTFQAIMTLFPLCRLGNIEKTLILCSTTTFCYPNLNYLVYTIISYSLKLCTITSNVIGMFLKEWLTLGFTIVFVWYILFWISRQKWIAVFHVLQLCNISIYIISIFQPISSKKSIS